MVRHLTLYRSLLVVALAMFAAQPAFALNDDNECGERAEAILHALFPQAKESRPSYFTLENASVTISTDRYLGTPPYAMICRQWPAQPQYLLVAAPLLTAEGDFEAAGDMEVAVLDHDNLKPVARHRVIGMINDDAIGLSLLAFDTAPYRLIDGRLAFGLRASRRGASRVNPFYQTGLWLFDMNGTALRPVLERFEVEKNTGEWDGNCNGSFEDMKRSLAMGRKIYHGAPDLLITTHSKSSEAAANKEDQCDEKDNPVEISKSRLRYDGHRYKVPEDMQVIE